MSNRHKIVFAIVLVAMFNLLLLVLFGDNGLVELNRMHDTHERLLKTNSRLTQSNLKLYRAIDRLQNDPAYIENVARQELGMIRSDEVIFKFKTEPKAQ